MHLYLFSDVASDVQSVDNLYEDKQKNLRGWMNYFTD